MTDSDALNAASNFDRLPEDAIVDTKTAACHPRRHAKRIHAAHAIRRSRAAKYRSAATASALAIFAR